MSFDVATFAEQLGALIERHGGTRAPALERACAEQIVLALAQSSTDGASLSPLDVARIRAGKFAATRLPPALFRAPERLAALRRDVSDLCRAQLGEAGSQGSRFG